MCQRCEGGEGYKCDQGDKGGQEGYGGKNGQGGISILQMNSVV